MTHLTEYQIQELIEKSKLSGEINIPDHVKSCPHCQQKIELYNQLFEALDQESDNVIVPNQFSNRVILAIEKQEQAFRKNMLMLISFCSIVFVGGLGLAVYLKLISLNPILSPFQTLFVVLQETFLGTIIDPLQSTFQTKLSLVLSGFIILFITILVDKYLLQPKLKIKHSALY